MTLQDILSRLDRKSDLTADDALDMRRAIFGGDDTVSVEEAEALIALNARARDIAPEWRMLFIEALTDFIVRQQDPVGYVDDAKAGWLMQAVSRDRCAKDDEIDLVIHVLDQADSAPASLTAFALDQLKTGILARAGAGIAKADVERLRQVLFAVGGDGNIAVSRAEAEALFDLNDALRGAPNDPAWGEFFVRGVANSVLVAPTWQAPDAQEEKRREAWVADRSIHPLKGFSALLHPKTALAQILSPRDAIFQEEQQRERADEALAADAERITADEGHWLLDRIGRDGDFDANEHALIAFLVANASGVDEQLQPLIERLSDRAERPAA